MASDETRARLGRVLRSGGLCLVAILVAWGVLHAWWARRDHARIPFGEGASWRFRVNGGPDTITLHVDGAADFRGTAAVLVSCDRNRAGAGEVEVGQAHVVDRWSGLDVVAVQQHFVNMRVLPYPFPYGREWSSKLGEDWTDRWKAECRGALAAESVTVPAGTFDCLHVSADIRFASQPPVVAVDYWIAPDVGPVKVRVDQRGFGETQILELELLAYVRPSLP